MSSAQLPGRLSTFKARLSPARWRGRRRPVILLEVADGPGGTDGVVTVSGASRQQRLPCSHFAPVMHLVYPFGRREQVVDNYHGTKVSDPYRWLERIDSQGEPDMGPGPGDAA